MRGSPGAEPDLGLGLLQALRRVVADVAVLALRLGPALELAELVELRMRGEHVVGLVEGLHRDLPVAVEVQPLAPLVAHVLQAERVEDLRGREQVVGQRFAVGIHVDRTASRPRCRPEPARDGCSPASARPSSRPARGCGCTRRRDRMSSRGIRRRRTCVRGRRRSWHRRGCRSAGGRGILRRIVPFAQEEEQVGCWASSKGGRDGP